MDQISLDRFDGGALQAKFQKAFEDVAENIVDPNTPAKAKRTIVIKMTVEPDEKRSVAAVSYDVKSTLAPERKEEISAFIIRGINGVELREHHPDQMAMEMSALTETPAAK